MKSRLYAIDLVRLIAVLFVVYAHLVCVGSFETSLSTVIRSTETLPILNHELWNLWKIDIFLFDVFSIQAATFGVTLFFVVTGYLMPTMMERYTRKEFLINRFFRIFPVLFTSLVLIAIFLYFSQNIIFGLESYLASITLTYPFLGIIPIVGVLWTLVIEVLFYLVTALMGKTTFKKLLLLQVSILIFIVIAIKFSEFYYLRVLAYNLKFVLMISIGSAVYLIEKEGTYIDKFIYLFSSFVIAYVGFYLYKVAFNDTSTYNNLGTFIISLFVLIMAVYWGKIITSVPKFILFFSDLVYPIYLIHVPLGLGVMVLLRDYIASPYWLCFCAFGITILISYLLHRYVEIYGGYFGKKIIKYYSKNQE